MASKRARVTADADTETGAERRDGSTHRDGSGDGADSLGREAVLEQYARTGYELDRHPAHVIRRAHQRATLRFPIPSSPCSKASWAFPQTVSPKRWSTKYCEAKRPWWAVRATTCPL